MLVAFEKVKELLFVGGAIPSLDDSLELLNFVVIKLLLVLEEPLTLVGEVCSLPYVIQILGLFGLELSIEFLFVSEAGSGYLERSKQVFRTLLDTLIL